MQNTTRKLRSAFILKYEEARYNTYMWNSEKLQKKKSTQLLEVQKVFEVKFQNVT